MPAKMPDLEPGKATICVVNYKTLDLTRLCLRSLRKFTNYPHDIIVVDNDSDDQSLKYLKSIPYIRLLERKNTNDPSGGYAHSAALDLGLAECKTEYFISLHSDVFIRKQGWLGDLISYFDNDQQVVCLGSGKIELTPAWQEFLKKATDFKTLKRRLLKVPDPLGKYRYYNRTICSIYKTEVLRQENLSFMMGRDQGLTAGKKLYFELIDKGYKTAELSPAVMGKYLVHLAHATQVVNLDEFSLRNKTIRKCKKLTQRVFAMDPIRELISDSSLDK
jgi:glycosyltransferase involved in cell wall biosynthesis